MEKSKALIGLQYPIFHPTLPIKNEDSIITKALVHKYKITKKTEKPIY